LERDRVGADNPGAKTPMDGAVAADRLADVLTIV
jgi:hypothetical protein